MELLLVVMPFGPLDQPSLGVSLLQAAVSERGIEASVRYYTFALASRLGTGFYRTVSQYFGISMIPGEWLFAEALFGEKTPSPDEYLHSVLSAQRPFLDPDADQRRFGGKRIMEHLETDIWPAFLAARRECPPLAAQAAREILAESPRIVGFSVSNQQICASLAVARLLKQAPEPPLIIFGGPACYGEMGLQMLRSFPCIDYVCTGEGDEVFPALAVQLLKNIDPKPLSGILDRSAQSVTLPPLTTNLDILPYPDFTAYFEQLEESPVYRDVAAHMTLPMETSRGCWWGEKHTCGFCGSLEQMRLFRSKSPERLLNELSDHVKRYHPHSICLVDDILDKRYFDTLFPRIAEKTPVVPFFTDSKVNVTRSQLQVLQRGGASRVQFGIETLSNRILKLLPKGNTVQQSIQAVRWSLELGISPVWNFLYGIPGEKPADYTYMTNIVPLFAHLAPPSCCYQVMIMRFSPYHRNPEKFGLLNLRPSSGYRSIFPLTSAEIDNLAYYFECEYVNGDPSEYVDPLRHSLIIWMKLWSGPADERPSLDLFRVSRSALLITDTRPCALQSSYRLEGLAAELYLLCDQARNLQTLSKKLAGQTDVEAIRQTLQKLVEARLLWQDDERFLSLALFRNRVK